MALNQYLMLRTGQYWWVVAWALCLWIGLYLVRRITDLEMSGNLRLIVLVVTLGTLFGVSAVFYLVRCPKCHAAILWRAVSDESFPGGLFGLLMARSCPIRGA